MKTLKYPLLWCLLLLYSTVYGQTLWLEGTVTDLQTNHTISGVLIENKSTNQSAITDENGYFKLHVMDKKGVVLVTVQGYDAKKVYYQVNEPLRILLSGNTQLLNSVKITAYGYQTNKSTAGAISLLDAKFLKQGNGVSLQQALNNVPGVRMDQSSLSDSRISIRGNGIRSPWGIRNIKIYVNNIPLTEADGTTRLEAVSVSDLGQAEIIRGPASSLYGAGTGGVIKFKLERSPYQEQSVAASALIGSYGLGRLAVTYRQSNQKLNSYVSYGHQVIDGYRSHSADRKYFLAANLQYAPSKKQLITLLISRSTQETQIPGAITADEVEADRQQANATNVEKKAGRHQNWTRIGIGQDFSFTDKLSNSTSLFTYFYDLDHPLPFGIIRNFYQSYGGRTVFNYNADFKILPTQFSLGGELNNARSKGTIYVNNKGKEGAVFSNTDYNDWLYFIFAQARVQFTPKTYLTMGVSYNSLRYKAQDYLHPERSGIKQFKPQFSPRIAIGHDFGDFLSLHGSFSKGFSAPTHNQIQNPDGSINMKLQSQDALNYEIDAKGALFDNRFSYDLALFRMDMKGELIGQTVGQGITIYKNAGKTNHTGVELALSWQILRPEDQGMGSTLRPYLSFTYSHFTFVEYKVSEGKNQISHNYSGNWLTGIAPWMLSAGIYWEIKQGFYGRLNYYGTAEAPLNDANTVYNEGWNVVNLEIGYKVLLWKKFKLSIYGGINNLGNSHYVSFTALNALAYGNATPAYYNPSPGRNYYAGLSLKYYLKIGHKK